MTDRAIEDKNEIGVFPLLFLRENIFPFFMLIQNMYKYWKNKVKMKKVRILAHSKNIGISKVLNIPYTYITFHGYR